MRRILIDSGILLSYYQQQQPLHHAVVIDDEQALDPEWLAVKTPEEVGRDGAMSVHNELGWAGCAAVESDPQIVRGAWVFRGTRIPVAALFENLEDGVSLAEFVELFPGVTQEQARVVAEAWSVQSRSRNC